MVAIVCGPSQGQLTQVACAHHEASDLVCQVHQDLRTLPCLRILVGHIMHLRVMPDILKVLHHRLSDIDFLDGHP